jgi:cell division septal protein FtsQ
MGKRIGANKRKKMTQHREKRHPAVSIFLPAIILGLAAAAGLALMFDPIIERIENMIAAPVHLKSSTVQSIVLQGAVHIKPEEILQRSGLKLPVTLDRLRHEYLDKFSKVNPWIGRVCLIQEREGAATLGIVERKPVAMVQTGGIVLVDTEGVCMPLDPKSILDLPLVSGLRDSAGNDGSRRLTGTDRGRMNRFLNDAEPFNAVFARRITQVNFRPDRTVRIMLSGSPAVVLLDENSTADRLGRLMQMWETVEGDSLPPARIDLSYRNLAFVTPAGVLAQAGKKNKS